jgi:hypothetical protein
MLPPLGHLHIRTVSHTIGDKWRFIFRETEFSESFLKKCLTPPDFQKTMRKVP